MYERTLGDRILSFGHEGILYERSFVMYDRETDSKWLHVTAQAVKGELRGQRLKMFPCSLTTWAAWKKKYPKTTVLGGERDEGFMGTFRGLDKSAIAEFGLAVLAYGEVRLYRYFDLLESDGLIHDEIDGTPILVALSRTAGIARAFDREVDGETLDFEFVSDDEDELLIKDTDTQTLFDGLNGVAVEGAFEGEELYILITFPILIDRYKVHFRDGDVYGEKKGGDGGDEQKGG